MVFCSHHTSQIYINLYQSQSPLPQFACPSYYAPCFPLLHRHTYPQFTSTLIHTTFLQCPFAFQLRSPPPHLPPPPPPSPTLSSLPLLIYRFPSPADVVAVAREASSEKDKRSQITRESHYVCYVREEWDWSWTEEGGGGGGALAGLGSDWTCECCVLATKVCSSVCLEKVAYSQSTGSNHLLLLLHKVQQRKTNALKLHYCKIRFPTMFLWNTGSPANSATTTLKSYEEHVSGNTR